MKIARMTVGPIAVNCYILWNDQLEGVIIDPGDSAERIMHFVTEQGLTIKAILLTHGHFDHIGASDALRNALSVPVYVHEAEAPMLSDAHANASLHFFDSPITAKADHLLKDGDELPLLGETFTVMHLPGHSPGAVCYFCGNVIFSGDVLFRGSYGRTDLPGGDPIAMRRSLRKLGTLTKDYTVYPGHGESTTILFEKQINMDMVADDDDLF